MIKDSIIIIITISITIIIIYYDYCISSCYDTNLVTFQM